MKVLFSGVQPITSPKQEKQNKPASNQNSYSSHPQQNAVFSYTYPPNYNVRFGMTLPKNPIEEEMSIRRVELLFAEFPRIIRGQPIRNYKSLSIRDLKTEADKMQESRMNLTKVPLSEKAKDFSSRLDEVRDKLKEHVQSGNIPEDPTQEEINTLFKLMADQDKEYQAGMVRLHNMSIDNAERLFQESEETRGLPYWEEMANGLHNARMYFAKNIVSENIEILPHFQNRNEIVDKIKKANKIIDRIKTHVETEKLPESTTQEERNDLLESRRRQEEEYDELLNSSPHLSLSDTFSKVTG